jgi:hypothetical protein
MLAGFPDGSDHLISRRLPQRLLSPRDIRGSKRLDTIVYDDEGVVQKPETRQNHAQQQQRVWNDEIGWF